jgi:plasmid stabilization system protein ParE
MGKKIVILPGALSDMDAAAEFYENQEFNLGREVYEFLKLQTAALSETAGIHPKERGVYKWALAGRFPYYTMFYRLKDDLVTVAAFIDGRRDPAHNRSLLKQRL